MSERTGTWTYLETAEGKLGPFLDQNQPRERRGSEQNPVAAEDLTSPRQEVSVASRRLLARQESV